MRPFGGARRMPDTVVAAALKERLINAFGGVEMVA
jgi:hypothetical protein